MRISDWSSDVCSSDLISDLSFDADGLAERGFQFVKIEAAALLDRASNDDAANEVRLLKQALDRAGVDLIVEGIETEQMLVELLDFNIDYGQRSEERRVGKECVSTCRSRWSTYHSHKNTTRRACREHEKSIT